MVIYVKTYNFDNLENDRIHCFSSGEQTYSVAGPRKFAIIFAKLSQLVTEFRSRALGRGNEENVRDQPMLIVRLLRRL